MDLSNATSNREAREREKGELVQTRKETMERMEGFFDKFGEVYAI